MATVVVLNGTSSSGKTTLARAFQSVAPTVFLNFSIDNILSALPVTAIQSITSGADISNIGIPELVRAYYACVRQLLDLGYDLVIDHAITARYHVEHLVAAVDSHRVIMVGLESPAEVLVERERARADRRPGMATAQLPRIHSWLIYDLTIDTSLVSPHDGARRIAEAIEAGTCDAFERTLAKLRAS
ncbi:MAG TPA: AAA family ATPase [Thermoanaerobaculia bacterium]|nr:AAA family ATPase [Thermoanaerobaculia bacterium]